MSKSTAEVLADDIQNSLKEANDVLSKLKESIWQKEDDKHVDSILSKFLIDEIEECQEYISDAANHTKNIEQEIYDFVDEDELREQIEDEYEAECTSTIHGTSIDWNEFKHGLPMNDLILMKTLDKAFFNGRTHEQIISLLETLF